MVGSMNLFRYSEPVAVEDLLDREDEAGELLANADEGTNSRLVAPRRYGKTSLLRRVLHDADRLDWATVYVDFFGVLTLRDIAERVEKAYAEQLAGPLGSWFAAVRRSWRPSLTLGGGPIPASVSAEPQSGALLDRLALPPKLHKRHGRRVLVVFDEFQDVLTAQDTADAVIRSEIQHHGDAASYVFAGSHVGMMRQLFADKRRAFYGQAAPVELPPLRPEDVGEYVSTRFDRTNRAIGSAIGPLLDTGQGHPQRTMLLAHYLWDETGPGDEADEEAWSRAYQRVMGDVQDELRAIWSGLSDGQRRVATAIAENSTGLYAANRRHGGSRGGAVERAVRGLEDLGEVAPDATAPTGYRLVDPLLARWIVDGRAKA